MTQQSSTPDESCRRERETARQLTRRDLLRAASLAWVAAAVPRGFAQPFAEAMTPFSYRASDAALEALRRRLEQTRWPEGEIDTKWGEGPPLASMRNVVDYWRDRYDWRRIESRLAGWPQFKTSIDGLGVHFIHVKSRHPNALPMMLTHGWPSTILLFQKVIDRLTDPTAYGGTSAEAFDVVIPSLPGFGFSDKPTESGWNAKRTARAWGVLMQRLGYERYVAQGGDWGAYVTTAMAQQPTAGLAAIHLNFAQTIPDVIPKQLLPDQKRAVDAMRAFRAKSGGYLQLQSTRPRTIGYPLADSPVGQAAWMYDIFNGGTGNVGNPERVLGLDAMLDEITLYWLSNSGASSARFYLEQLAAIGRHNNAGRVEMPVGVSVFPNDMPVARSWAPRVYPKLFYWHEADRGGHFAQLEVPDLFVDELRFCFRTIRMTPSNGR
jgi:epoxide hydrolase